MPTRYALPALALLLALVAAAPARAQHDDAIAAVKQHFVSQAARYGASTADLPNADALAVTRAYASRRSGATYVHLQQVYNGLPIYNARAQAVVTQEGAVFAPHASLAAGVAERANAATPELAASSAAAAAAQHLLDIADDWYIPSGPISDSPSEASASVGAGYLTFVPESARLVYYAVEGGPVRLAWDLALEAADGQHYFTVRVDAADGHVFEYADLVSHDHWGFFQGGRLEAAPGLAPLAAAAGARAGGAAYNVFAVPLEGPTDGGRTLVVDPADPSASPLGWHDTGSTTYTITRGNNVHAYADTDDNDQPDPGSEPDGGAGLVFDFPLDFSQPPAANQDAAITNLFYWNNVIHDVLWHYGFDEASGNFQVNNFGNGGLGNDDVQAEAQDGGGFGNANFFTPSDGQRPRMQMYLWAGPNAFTVTTPPEIAGTYVSLLAGFGAQTPPDADMAGEVALVDDGTEQGQLGCEPLVNAAEVAGKIALIERGVCEFGLKALHAQEAGAIGVTVYNCEPDPPDCNATTGEEVIVMGAGASGGQVTIPAYMVGRSTGLAIADALPGVTVEASSVSIDLDGDFDNAIIVHEYGHGVSGRLGGVGCLVGDEQMGEGWSDYYAMMMTMEEGDTGADVRPMSPYVSFGAGIRTDPYTTDFTFNAQTYATTRTAIVPHGVGEVWATIIWEMTWELMEAEGLGFDPDLYNAEGTAGNQIALQLVTEGLKLQPCAPGFVTGRDAILEADTLLYGGVHADAMWRAFARRGLGVFAEQGSVFLNSDNVEDFTHPENVASEGQAAGLPGGFRLSAAYPNPFGGPSAQAQFTLEVAAPQAVRVEVFDALGRRVALLHDGDLAAGMAHRFAVDGHALASGTYFVRAAGEAFTATERVTLLK